MTQVLQAHDHQAARFPVELAPVRGLRAVASPGVADATDLPGRVTREYLPLVNQLAGQEHRGNQLVPKVELYFLGDHPIAKVLRRCTLHPLLPLDPARPNLAKEVEVGPDDLGQLRV